MPKKSEIITIKTNNNIDPLQELIREQEIQNTKSQALKNSEVLLNILETLEKMNDRLMDIHLNNVKIYQYVKKQEDVKTEELKGGWFY